MKWINKNGNDRFLTTYEINSKIYFYIMNEIKKNPLRFSKFDKNKWISTPYLDLKYYNDDRYVQNAKCKITNLSIFPIAISESKMISHLITGIYKNNKIYIIDTSGALYNYRNFFKQMYIFFNEIEIITNAERIQRIESEYPKHFNEIKGYCEAWTYFIIKCIFMVKDECRIDEIIQIIIEYNESDPEKLRKLIRSFCSISNKYCIKKRI